MRRYCHFNETCWFMLISKSFAGSRQSLFNSKINRNCWQICYCFNSLNISSAVVPKSFAGAERLDVLGSEAPLSHFETACLLTPSTSATNSCVILHSIRCRFITSPIDFAMSDFSFLTGSDLRYFLNAIIKRAICPSFRVTLSDKFF